MRVICFYHQCDDTVYDVQEKTMKVFQSAAGVMMNDYSSTVILKVHHLRVASLRRAE
jgi:hypothetical protein